MLSNEARAEHHLDVGANQQMGRSQPMPDVLVIGDDLTGTNATAAMYARDGLRAVTVLSTVRAEDLPADLDVLACSTDSRHMTPRAAAHAVTSAIERYGRPGMVIVKRVDTTLRGNIGAELDAALGCARAMNPHRRLVGLLVPAFPSARRVTIGGYQILDDSPILMGPAGSDPFNPVRHSNVASIVTEQSSVTVAQIGLDTVMAGEQVLGSALLSAAADADIVIVDSVNGKHQTAIAEAATSVRGDDVDWVIFDTGPFGAAYARARGLRPGRQNADPILAIIGSPTEQSRQQADALEREADAQLVTIQPGITTVHEARLAVSRAISGGYPVVGIRTTPSEAGATDSGSADRVLELIREFAVDCCAENGFGGVYATGGDVGMNVLGALGATGYAIESEVLPLAVCGALVGGPYEGLGFATKGGLIGEEDAAVRCVEALQERLGTQRTVAA